MVRIEATGPILAEHAVGLEHQSRDGPGVRGGTEEHEVLLGEPFQHWMSMLDRGSWEVAGKLLQYHPQRQKYHILLGICLAHIAWKCRYEGNTSAVVPLRGVLMLSHLDQHGHRPGKAPAVAVEHGQGPQVAREMRHGPGGGIADGVQVSAPVVRDHPLGIARGAAGVAHGNRIPLVARAFERHYGGALHELVGPGGERALHPAHRLGDGLWCGGIAQPPARHGEALGEAIHGDRPLAHAGQRAE